MTGLEALEDIILYLNASEPKGLYCENIETIQQDLLKAETIQQALLKAEKEHKALEIIKGKNVWVGRLKSLFRKYNNNLDVLRVYNANMWVDYQLTEEEYELLRKVLE